MRLGDHDIVIRCESEADKMETLALMKELNMRNEKSRWIDIMVGDMLAQACEKCNAFYPFAYTGGGHRYCPNCGRRMFDYANKTRE